MPLNIAVTLTDAVGAAAVGGGTWQATVLNNGAPIFDTGTLSYSGGTLAAAPALPGAWTNLRISVTPARYAPASVELVPSTNGSYRDDSLAVVNTLQQDSASIGLPLLRLREAIGVAPPSDPKVGASLAGPWLQAPPGHTNLVYRELLVTPWLAKHAQTTTVSDSASKTGVFGDPDKDSWDRFNTRGRGVDPAVAGATMLLEYGEVGTNASAGPRFLVGIWAPTRMTPATVPTWRDMVGFIHPSTAKTWYPPVAFPFRDPYPYVVGDNPNVPPKHPDRTYQPYVNLAMRYLVGDWSPYQLAGNEAVLVTPVFPNPVPSRPDNLEYGLPFRTTAGLARLMAEVNLFLHRIRYGFSGMNFDRWWGSQSISIRTSSTVEAKAPTLRRVAVAAYSSAAAQLDLLLSGQALSSGRYPVDVWSVPNAALDQFGTAWQEAWCLDLLADSTTVPAATLEGHLKAWVDAKSGRKFIMGGSGTTGHDNPDTHYPVLSKATAAKIAVQATADATRHASLWRGPSDQWVAFFCSNPYLSASAPDASRWPDFPVAPTADEAHGFMFEITSGFAFSVTNVGVP